MHGDCQCMYPCVLSSALWTSPGQTQEESCLRQSDLLKSLDTVAELEEAAGMGASPSPRASLMCPARLIGEGGSLLSISALLLAKLPSFFCARSHLGGSFWASVSSHTDEEVVVSKAIHVTGLFVCLFVFLFSSCCLLFGAFVDVV